MSTPHLMIPGPVESEDDILAALSQPTMPHYGPLWMPLFNETTDLLKRLFRTSYDMLIIPGPGSGALDAAIGSMIPPGKGVVVINNGHFGKRLTQIVESYGLQPWVAEFPQGLVANPERIREQLKQWVAQAQRTGSSIEALALVQSETSTGVLNPVAEIARVAHEFGLAVIVDAVSSLGGVELDVDNWGIDICVGVPNKCLAAVPGVALMSVSPRAWEMAHRNPARHGWYHDLRTWAYFREAWGAWHPYPTTLPTNVIVALHRALVNVFEVGLETWFSSFAKTARHVREALALMGFNLFPDPAYAAPMISAFRVREDVVCSDLIRYLLIERNIMIGGGLDELQGRIFRIGHMGRARLPEMAEAVLDGIHSFLISAGLPVGAARAQ